MEQINLLYKLKEDSRDHEQKKQNELLNPESNPDKLEVSEMTKTAGSTIETNAFVNQNNPIKMQSFNSGHVPATCPTAV